MLRILMKQYSNCRFLSTTIYRLNESIPKLDVLTNSKHASQKLTDLSDDTAVSKPPVYAEPFTELQTEETQNMPSEIGEFVDSLGPPLPISFNLAAYVNHSESLKNLVRLGVDLSEIEQKPERAKFVLNLDFEKDIKHHIQFLHDNGVSADDMGRFFTKNIFIFKERIEDLEVRINYLKSKKFTSDAIARIIANNPYFLNLDTKQVDNRLGFLQKQFSLTGNEVRYLVAKCPKLVTHSMNKFR
ncbi:Transcription termination factor 3, mitochondrial, partial [Araneus ventricosus]